MTWVSARRRRAIDRRQLAVLSFLALLVGCVLIGRPVEAGAAAGGRLVAEPVLSVTAAGARQLFGASPAEAQGEIWGVGSAANEVSHIIRYTDETGWEAVPDPIGPEGETVALSGPRVIPETATAGRTTAAGGVVTVAEFGEGQAAHQDLIIRDPGGPFRAVPAPPPVELEEALFSDESTPVVKLTAVEEPTGKTGAFVAPDPGAGLVTDILHFDGTEWSREVICLETVVAECEADPLPVKAKPQGGFQVVAIEAAGPGQAWMLAQSRNSGIVLLKREPESHIWVKHKFSGTLGAELEKERPTIGGARVTIASRAHGQPLTVTSKGVWVDAEVSFQAQFFDATLYYDVGEGDPRQGELTGSWCDPGEALPEQAGKELCEFPLGSKLPSGEARSFAWPPLDPTTEPYGRRAITGIGQGALLIFENGAFSRIPLSGGGGTTAGAALSAPDEGWLGPSYRLTREPVPSGLQSWSVPFRRPLLAVAPQPGVPVGELSSEALAVGAEGEVARYLPGVGWQPESLLSGSGARATPTLRSVAWPTPSFAYAVGDEGAMWLWRASTGLWEPDPGAPPNLIRGNFTGIAFDPEEPEKGYAVGKQGLLLEYGKRWTQVQLPAGLSPEINITSIAFAGHEAIATWALPVGESAHDISGVIVNDGSGWRTEEAATAALLEVEDLTGRLGTTAWRVAGLPDGGAVIVGAAGGVIEREAASDPWHAVPGSLVGFPDAVAAVREGGQVRAVISVSSTRDAERILSTDAAQAVGQPPAGQAPLLTEPYPLPESGFLIRQTAHGWRDEQRQDYPSPPENEDLKPGSGAYREGPAEPDPILALLLSAEGTQGWALGGQTGENPQFKERGSYVVEGVQTATAERYGPAASVPVNSAATAIPVAADEPTFAVGGGIPCETTCADEVNIGVQPEVWLPAAVGRAASIPGLRGFIYAGAGVSNHLELAKVSAREFSEEETAYANRLGSNAGGLPVFTTPSPSDRDGSSMSAFENAFAGFPQPLGGAPAEPKVVPYSAGERDSGNYSYSFTSVSESGTEPVRVIALDESITPSTNLCWLSGQLADAKREQIPAIVAGDREVGAEAELKEVLVTGASAGCPQAEGGGASAYFYSQTVSAGNELQAIEGNISSTLSSGQASIPAFGTSSLGFLTIGDPEFQSQEPASGFLLASVDVAARSGTTNVAPVSVRLIPSIGSLAINALDGTLLRRSQPALFEALARRPIAGSSCGGPHGGCGPDPYVQIPSRCVAGHGYDLRPCGVEISPEYRFTSSRPDIANFVAVDPSSTERRAVFLDSSGEPVPDPTSGLLCAFNSGTTTVSIETGGLSYSVPVTVRQGSVARPCGTVPRTDLSAKEKELETPPPPIEGKPGFESGPKHIRSPHHFVSLTHITHPTQHQHSNPVRTHSTPAIHHPIPIRPAPFVSTFSVPAATLSPVVVILPPPPPPAVEPTPPSGTSPVTQPAVSPEPEEEEETAIEHAHQAAAMVRDRRRVGAASAAYRYRAGGSQVPWLIYAIPTLVLVAALSSSGIAGRRRRREAEPAFLQSRR